MLRRGVMVVALLLGVVALLAVACSGGDGGQTDDEGLTQTADADGVTVEGTWLTAGSLGSVDADLTSYPLDEFVLVEVQFTTHSGDLNEIDMERASGLKQGDEAAAPVAWVSLSDDSHHREGILVFQRAGREGPAELTLDLGNDEVALLWEAVPAG